MVVNVDITIEKNPSMPGYVFFSEEDWNKILKVLAIRRVNINLISGQHEETEK